MPEDSLQSLKQHPKVLDLYRSRLSLKQDGKRWRGLCPFHDDRNAGNFDVYQHQGTWIYHCLACNASGSVLDVVQKTDNCSFPEAVKIVRDAIGEWGQNRKQVEGVFRALATEPKKLVTYTEAQYAAYEQALRNSPEAQAFLAGRGITLETAKRLRIGFRQDVGKLAGESNADIAGRGWLAFPTFGRGNSGSPESVVTSIKYRSICRKSFTKQSGMVTALFHTSSIDFLEPVFLVEGELDACVLEQAGFRAVSLPNATYNCSPEDKDRLLEAEHVILAGDNDEAGQKSMLKLFREMKERTYLLRWPEGIKDANAFWDKCGRNLSVFRTEVGKLVDAAKSKPMEGVYDVRQSLLTTTHTSAADDPNRLRFPWPSVDSMAVISPGTVTTVYSSESGQGKSTWVLQATLFGAMKHGEVVINYQAEMMPQQIDTILASHLLRKDRLTLTEEDYREAGRRLPANMQYYIGRNTSLTNIGQVLDLIEAAVRRFGASCVVLDNLHFLCRSEQDQVKAQANAMQRITNLAGEYKLKFLVVHQARKADQNHKRKVTHVSDLDGSKAVQNDSSVILSLHREEIKHSRDDDTAGANEYDPMTEIRLQKVREKGPGKSYTTLLFAGNISTFAEVAHEPDTLFSQ